VDKANTDY